MHKVKLAARDSDDLVNAQQAFASTQQLGAFNKSDRANLCIAQSLTLQIQGQTEEACYWLYLGLTAMEEKRMSAPKNEWQSGLEGSIIQAKNLVCFLSLAKKRDDLCEQALALYSNDEEFVPTLRRISSKLLGDHAIGILGIENCPLSVDALVSNTLSSTKAQNIYQKPKPGVIKGLRTVLAKLFDTEILFSVGDLMAATLAAEKFGIILWSVTTAFSVFDRFRVLLLKKPPLALGFKSMAAISSFTVASIILNGYEKFGSNFTPLHNQETASMYGMLGAFAAWTMANLMAGVDKARGSQESSNFIKNAQFWFCIGSIFATQAQIVPLILFSVALIKSIKGYTLGEDQIPNSLSQFTNKHLTPNRIRAIAYLGTAISIVGADWRLALPYSFWALGNLAFDQRSKNKSFMSDLKMSLLTKQG